MHRTALLAVLAAILATAVAVAAAAPWEEEGAREDRPPAGGHDVRRAAGEAGPRDANRAGRAAEPPAPDEAIPREPAALAGRVHATQTALRRAVTAWLRDGDPARERPPEDLVLHALHGQRLHRHLARRPRLSQAVLRALPPRTRTGTREVLEALDGLRRLTPPSKAPRLRTGPARPPGVLLGLYRRAQRRFGVGWHVLAAVNFVESSFGKVRSSSVAGAQGPMQFIPGTWAAYGLGGDVHDPRDAIMGAANLLRANGAPRDYRRALFRYNPSQLYVRSVLRFARRMARDRRDFYGFYAWQVYVRWRGGERRLTGPGLDG